MIFTKLQFFIVVVGKTDLGISVESISYNIQINNI